MSTELIKAHQVCLSYKGLERLALNRVDLSISGGETLGIVGESGSGKSSLGRCLLGLEAYTGHITLAGKNIQHLLREDRKAFSRSIQMVFQDPLNSLNPRMTIESILTEILTVHGLAQRDAVHEKIITMLEKVGLGREVLPRFPHELSGGQRQRTGIARALLVNPQLIIADEPVSALDVSVQAQIIQLLTRLVETTGIALILIAHDLAVVRYVCERIAVMNAGEIVEAGNADQIIHEPAHPYTKALLSSVPDIDAITSDKNP